MINNYPIINIYESKNKSSKLSSQMLYGESFKVKKKFKNWIKIKTSYDGYNGYILKKKIYKKFKNNP